MATRAAGVADDDANNRSLQKLVQQRFKKLNAGKATISVNASVFNKVKRERLGEDTN